MDGRMDWTVFQRYDIDMMCHQMPLKSPEKIMDYGQEGMYFNLRQK